MTYLIYNDNQLSYNYNEIMFFYKEGHVWIACLESYPFGLESLQ